MKLVWFLMIVFVQKSLQKEEGTIPVGVTRRSSGDIVFFDENSEITVCNVTYLVEERQCVSDQDVINGRLPTFIHYTWHLIFTLAQDVALQ